MKLPELPESTRTLSVLTNWGGETSFYTADQMREYARAALATPTPEASAGVEERARELLAAECAECGGEGGYMAAGGDEGGVWHNCGTCRDGERLGSVNRHQALTAIAAALRTPAKTDGDVGRVELEKFRLPVEIFKREASRTMILYGHPGNAIERDERDKAKRHYDEADRLLALIDTPPAQQDALAVDDAMVERVSEAVWPVAKSSMESRWDRAGTQRQDFVRRFVRAALTAALAAGNGEAVSG